MSDDPMKVAYAACPTCLHEYRGISYESREHAHKNAYQKAVDCVQRHEQARIRKPRWSSYEQQ